MDPISALTIACAVVNFAEFGAKLTPMRNEFDDENPESMWSKLNALSTRLSKSNTDPLDVQPTAASKTASIPRMKPFWLSCAHHVKRTANSSSAPSLVSPQPKIAVVESCFFNLLECFRP